MSMSLVKLHSFPAFFLYPPISYIIYCLRGVEGPLVVLYSHRHTLIYPLCVLGRCGNLLDHSHPLITMKGGVHTGTDGKRVNSLDR